MTHLIAKSARLRSTPYTKRIEEYGVQSYTVYNHMLLPASFKGIEEDSRHLKKNVQLWDVSGERQVQIHGPDAAKLTQLRVEIYLRQKIIFAITLQLLMTKVKLLMIH